MGVGEGGGRGSGRGLFRIGSGVLGGGCDDESGALGGEEAVGFEAGDLGIDEGAEGRGCGFEAEQSGDGGGEFLAGSAVGGFDEVEDGGADFGGGEEVGFAEDGRGDAVAGADADGAVGEVEAVLLADAGAGDEEVADAAGDGVLEAGAGAGEVPEVADADDQFVLVDGAFGLDDFEEEAGHLSRGEGEGVVLAGAWEGGEGVGIGGERGAIGVRGFVGFPGHVVGGVWGGG